MQSKPYRPFSCRQEIAEQDYHDSAMYKEMMDRTNIEYSLLVTVPGDNNLLSGLGIFRGKEGKPFTKREVNQFGLLVPHLKRVATIQSTLVNYNEKQLVAIEAIENIPTGILIADDAMKVHHINKAAQEIIDQENVFAIRDDYFFVNSIQHASQIKTCIRECASYQTDNFSIENFIYSIPKSKGNPYSLVISPLWRNKQRLNPDMGLRPYAILYITDPDKPQETSVEYLQRLYGLSQAEGKLTKAILEGISVAEFAIINDLSENTVRNQLKSIFAKTNISRQSDLIRLVLSSPLNFT